MIVEYVRYRLSAAQVEAFLAGYTEAALVLDRAHHCEGYELSRCVEDEALFTLRILWDSVAGHLDGFRKSPDFAAFLRPIRAFVAAIEEMHHYELTPVRSSRP